MVDRRHHAVALLQGHVRVPRLVVERNRVAKTVVQRVWTVVRVQGILVSGYTAPRGRDVRALRAVLLAGRPDGRVRRVPRDRVAGNHLDHGFAVDRLHASPNACKGVRNNNAF